MAIITISREMGSGGIPIVHQVAEELGYKLVDGDAIKDVAAQYGLTDEHLLQADEKPPAFVEKLDRQIELSTNRIQLIVLEEALKGNVIIYGRGGQDLLPGLNNVFRVRVIAPFEDRVERWAEREWIDPDLARSLVRKSDQQRAGFIKYYFDRDWEDPLNYDLVINTVRLSNETAVKLIAEGVKDQNLLESKTAGKAKLRDLIIQKKLQIARLADERIDEIWFNIEVEKGHVTLSGHVYSEAEREVALGNVQETEGVTGVTDNLKIIGYRNDPHDN
ncbi:Cytidylate kinase [Malonomonas rubra DSM 5091]|uniref:Cytidylate kinase n=1 Tax=Malonomonas rubra DSM 5091 TaxID=1122189 RepID=A0A1M6M4S6_MALRU|nr:cytidylate kinase family protein [Malonomonas rubra]SHJ78416.1 Cytidylate kinase [Malonomonas rubra DSM 5091]